MGQRTFILGATYKIVLVNNTERIFTFVGGNPAMVKFQDDNTSRPIDKLPPYLDIKLVSDD